MFEKLDQQYNRDSHEYWYFKGLRDAVILQEKPLFIFKSENRVNPEALEKIRQELVTQIKSGVVLLSADIDLISFEHDQKIYEIREIIK